MSNNDDRRLITFLAISFIFHVLFFYFVSIFPDEVNKIEKPVELTLMSYRIADILPPENEEKPDDARFLGMYDSKVEKERVTATPPDVSEKKERFSMIQPKGEGEGELESKPTEEWESNEAYPEDFYPDYTIDNHTYLNVLRYPRVAYFVRLKKVFKVTFNPIPAIRPYYYSNQITRGQVEVVLGVTVDRYGNLSKIFVINSSGFDLYDREALRTVKDSSPFSSPPDELLDENRELKMAWTFTVYL